MKILGLNGWSERGHDAGAALLINGKLKFAIEEERLTGIRHAYDSLPTKSIEVLLNETSTRLDEIDKIAIGWDYPKLWKMIGKDFITKEKMSISLFGTDRYSGKIEYVNHHFAHACSAFYPSNFNKALVLVIDGQGEYMATSVFVGNRKERSLKKVYETPVSLGYFYSAITEHIGFYSGQEGKTMGLASYGKPIYVDKLREHINAGYDGKINCTFEIKKTSKDEEEATIQKWQQILSNILPERKDKILSITDDVIPYANLAASAQLLLEEILITVVKYNCEKYDLENVALAGGVALNCAASGTISKFPCVNKIFTQPAANDGGISLGAALAVATNAQEEINFEMLPYQGNQYTDKEILKELANFNYSFRKSNNLEKDIAKLIFQGNIVANFQGRLEYGPRALGNRSLLADPRKYDMLVRLNNLKGREVWRPLAPAVLFEKQEEYFSSNQFSPYMTINCDVLKSKQQDLQAITHVDGTARIQSVTKEYNQVFYNIINEFYKLSKVPVVINTSFNIRGKPIVSTPREAVISASKMNLDYLAIGNYIVKLK